MRLTLEAVSVEALRRRRWTESPHGFLGRRGGVSDGVCAGLNVGLGSGDDRDAIRRESPPRGRSGRARRAARHPPPGPFGRPRSAVDRALSRRCPARRPTRMVDRPARPRARHPHRRLRAGPVRRLARQGWSAPPMPAGRARSAAWSSRRSPRWSGWAPTARRIAAAVGPCIARRSYEVDDGFLRRFAEAEPDHERFFAAGREGHHQFDLEGFVLVPPRRRGPRPGRGAGRGHLFAARPLLQLPPRDPSRRAGLRPADLLIALGETLMRLAAVRRARLGIDPRRRRARLGGRAVRVHRRRRLRSAGTVARPAARGQPAGPGADPGRARRRDPDRKRGDRPPARRAVPGERPCARARRSAPRGASSTA